MLVVFHGYIPASSLFWFVPIVWGGFLGVFVRADVVVATDFPLLVFFPTQAY